MPWEVFLTMIFRGESDSPTDVARFLLSKKARALFGVIL